VHSGLVRSRKSQMEGKRRGGQYDLQCRKKPPVQVRRLRRSGGLGEKKRERSRQEENGTYQTAISLRRV